MTLQDEPPADSPLAPPSISPSTSGPSSTYEEMSNPQVVVVAGESNARTPPKFSGSGFAWSEDALQFLDDFKEAATWNNWSIDTRLKELFYRCLQGYAKEWFNVHVRTLADYQAGAIPFEAQEEGQKSLISLFKERFVTPVWFARYKDWYDNRKQGASKGASHYILYKTALYHKANAEGTFGKSEKERLRDIRKGLLPHLQRTWYHSRISHRSCRLIIR